MLPRKAQRQESTKGYGMGNSVQKPLIDAFLIALMVPKTLASTLMTCLAMLAVPRFVKVKEGYGEKYFASQATTGSVSYISYGARIVTVVNNFYLRNVSQALFPSIASHFAQSKPRRAMEEVIQLITTPVLGILVYARGAWLMDYPEMTLAVKKLLTRKKNKTSSEKST